MSFTQRLAELDSNNTEWQRDLLLTHRRIDDLLRDQGDLAGALVQYLSNLTIAQHLAEQDPSNTVWQRGLALTHFGIGDLLRDLEDRDALKSYQSGLAITERLVEHCPGQDPYSGRGPDY